MLKKNVYERRFNTAGARIIMSSKLPSDFFKPIIQREEKECSLWEHVSSRNEEGCRSPKIIVMNPKEEMQFTFHRSNSEGKAVPKEKIFREKLPYLRSS